MNRPLIRLVQIAGLALTLGACGPEIEVDEHSPRISIETSRHELSPFVGLWMTGRRPILWIRNATPDTPAELILLKRDGTIEDLRFDGRVLSFAHVDPDGRKFPLHLKTSSYDGYLTVFDPTTLKTRPKRVYCAGQSPYLERYHPWSYTQAELKPVIDDMEDAVEDAIFDGLIRHVPDIVF